MAFPASYVNGRNLSVGLTGTSVNLGSDTIKAALFTDSVTGADKNANEKYGTASWNANEATGTGYTAGGKAVTVTVPTPSAGKWMLKNSSATLDWTSATFTTRGVLVYDDTASKLVLAAINFGSDQAVVSGTFTITWDATNGIFYATY